MTDRNWLILRANLIRMSWFVGLLFWTGVTVLAVTQPERGTNEHELCNDAPRLLALCE